MDSVQSMNFMEPRHPEPYNFPITAHFMGRNKYAFAPSVSLGTWVAPMVTFSTRPQYLHFRHRLIPWELSATPTHQSTNMLTPATSTTAHFLSKTNLRHSRLLSVTLETQVPLSHLSATKASSQMIQFALENFRTLIHNLFTASRLRWEYPILMPTHFKWLVLLRNPRISCSPQLNFPLNSRHRQESN
jgi:hypothetical protein